AAPCVLCGLDSEKAPSARALAGLPRCAPACCGVGHPLREVSVSERAILETASKDGAPGFPARPETRRPGLALPEVFSIACTLAAAGSGLVSPAARPAAVESGRAFAAASRESPASGPAVCRAKGAPAPGAAS